jgi:hypothetical protein
LIGKINAFDHFQLANPELLTLPHITYTTFAPNVKKSHHIAIDIKGQKICLSHYLDIGKKCDSKP